MTPRRKYPSLGSELRVKWIDHGLVIGKSLDDAKKENFECYSWGKYVGKDRKCLYLCQNYFGHGDSNNDHMKINLPDIVEIEVQRRNGE